MSATTGIHIQYGRKVIARPPTGTNEVRMCIDCGAWPAPRRDEDGRRCEECAKARSQESA